MEFREIEIKLKVNNLDELEEKLKQAGCVFAGSIRQHDTLYSSDANLNKHEGHIAIRIRNENNVHKLTLKQQRSNEMDNIECETKVDNPESVNRMLEILGWKKEEIEIIKNRKKGKLGEYEVCLDRVDKLGDYVELEKMTHDNDDPEKVREELFKALEPFGLTRNDEETKGYDTLMYLLKDE